jgi:hypothetical protein
MYQYPTLLTYRHFFGFIFILHVMVTKVSQFGTYPTWCTYRAVLKGTETYRFCTFGQQFVHLLVQVPYKFSTDIQEYGTVYICLIFKSSVITDTIIYSYCTYTLNYDFGLSNFGHVIICFKSACCCTLFVGN